MTQGLSCCHIQILTGAGLISKTSPLSRLTVDSGTRLGLKLDVARVFGFLKVWDLDPRVSILKDPDRSCTAFQDLVSEVTWHHFLCSHRLTHIQEKVT